MDSVVSDEVQRWMKACVGQKEVQRVTIVKQESVEFQRTYVQFIMTTLWNMHRNKRN